MLESQAPEPQTADAPQRSVFRAFLFWLFLGGYGAHRFYLGRTLTGFVYVALVAVAVLTETELVALVLGVMWIADAFLLRKLTAECNERLAAAGGPELDPETGKRTDIAPWARRPADHWSYVLFTPLRVAGFVLLPALFVAFAIIFELGEMILFPFFILGAVGLMTSMNRVADSNLAVREFPVVGAALERIDELRDHYWENEPRVLHSYLGLFTKREYRPYWKIVAVGMLTIVLDTLIDYGDTYQHLGPADAIEIILLTLIGATLVVMLLLMPLTAMSFHYSLSGKRGRLHVLSLVSIATMIGSYYVFSQEEADDEAPSIMSDQLIHKRMATATFREELTASLQMLLSYDECSRQAGCNQQALLTQVVSGLVPNSEYKAFRIHDAKIMTELPPETVVRDGERVRLEGEYVSLDITDKLYPRDGNLFFDYWGPGEFTDQRDLVIPVYLAGTYTLPGELVELDGELTYRWTGKIFRDETWRRVVFRTETEEMAVIETPLAVWADHEMYFRWDDMPDYVQALVAPVSPCPQLITEFDHASCLEHYSVQQLLEEAAAVISEN